MNHLKLLRSPVELGLKKFNMICEPVTYQKRVLKDFSYNSLIVTDFIGVFR